MTPDRPPPPSPAALATRPLGDLIARLIDLKLARHATAQALEAGFGARYPAHDALAPLDAEIAAVVNALDAHRPG